MSSHRAGNAGALHEAAQACPAKRAKTPAPGSAGLRRLLESLYQAGGYLAAAAVVGVFVVMIGSALFRAMGWPTRGTNDVVAWLSAAAAFLGLAHTFKHGDLVRVSLLLEALSPRWRQRFELATLSVAAVFSGYLSSWALIGTYDSYQFGQLADGLIPMPMWIPQCSFVVGSALLLLAVVDELVMVALGRKPGYVRMVEERHAKGDFSSEV
jgi:TRAP-type C4-dicarboxylate transport system permease small subunit